MATTNTFLTLLFSFGREMGIEEYLRQGILFLACAVLVIAFLNCFFGFKVYRIWTIFISFFLVAIGLTALIGPLVNRGILVTTFTLLGIITAFIFYQNPKAGAFVLCAYIGFVLMGYLTQLLWLRIVGGVALALCTIPWYFHIIVFSTSIWGGLTLVPGIFTQFSLSGIPLPYQYIIGGVLAAIGIFVQYKMNRKWRSAVSSARPKKQKRPAPAHYKNASSKKGVSS